MFSIRYKFLSILVGLVVATILSFLGLATKLFESDKEAYVYDASVSVAEALGTQTEVLLDQAQATLRRSGDLVSQPGEGADLRRGVVDALFRDDPDLIYLGVYPPEAANSASTPAASWVREEFLEMHGLDASALTALQRAWPVSFGALEGGKPRVAGGMLTGGVPVLGVALLVAAEPRIAVVGFLKQDRILQVFSKSRMHTAFLLDAYGSMIAHPDVQRTLAKTGISDAPWVKKIAANPLRTGALELTMPDGAQWLTAYSKLAAGGLTVIAQVARAQAFEASRRLVQKSALFAVALICFAFILSLVSSRTVTQPIRRLFEATKRIAEGDFSVRVKETTKDEIGTLTTSFNGMAGRIVELMGAVRDKARMEKELETARLVQENLFPVPQVSTDGFELAGFYTPASECGGDWWGHFVVGNRLYVLIGDATGHGVPAALITAAAQACCTTIHQTRLRAPSLPLTPATIMADLNAAVHQAARGKMNMTFFVAMIDFEASEVIYCNASHELPILIRKNGAEVDADMLTGDPDPCLGEAIGSTYHEHKMLLRQGDTLFWYTDGLLELRDANDREWGERKLVKVLKAAAGESTDSLKARVIDTARAHQGDRPADDDITYIVVRVRSTATQALAS